MAGTAGSVAPVFHAEGYVATNIYDFYHAIIHNNKLYFCRKDGTVGHEPIGITDEYWFLSLDGTFADAASLGGETALQWQRKINVEKARIDQLIAMEEESIVTDIEKELADIRVGSNGVTYEDAGTAVREQMAVRNVATRKVSEIPDVKLPLDEVLEEIDAKTDEAFKAMEEKAKETIESIPADYTALSNDVTGIKSDLIQLEQNKILMLRNSDMWQKGTLSGTDGSVVSTTLRIVTKDLFSSENNVQVVASNGYQFCIAKYYLDGTFISRSGFADSETLYSGYAYRIEVKLLEDSSLIAVEDCNKITAVTPLYNFEEEEKARLLEKNNFLKSGTVRLFLRKKEWVRKSLSASEIFNSVSRLTTDGYYYANNSIEISSEDGCLVRYAPYDLVDGVYVLDKLGVRPFSDETRQLEKGRYYKFEIMNGDKPIFDVTSNIEKAFISEENPYLNKYLVAEGTEMEG